MEITRICSRAVSVPVRFPVVSCVRETNQVIFVLVDVITDTEITGISYAQAFNVHGAQAIMNCLSYLEAVVMGHNPSRIEELWDSMREASKLLGLGGLPMFALSLIDIALWDIRGKEAGVPVCRLLGAEPGSFDAYQSDGLWLVSPTEAAYQAKQFMQEGFTAMKMRLGRNNVDDDIRTVQEIRNSTGNEIELMADVNQGWSCDNAIDMSKRLTDYQLTWLEEPVDAADIESYVRITKTTSIPVATGENLYGSRLLQHFLQSEAASIYTPDLQRCGGITGWLTINSLPAMKQIRTGFHLFPEYAVHLFPLICQPVKLEWISWPRVLFAQPLSCEDGQVKTPQRPGFGTKWNDSIIERYAIS